LALEAGRGGGEPVPRANRLLVPGLMGIAAVSAVFAPRLLDYTLGVLFLAFAAWGLWPSSNRPTEECDGPQCKDEPCRVMLVGIVGLVGGGSIAWGWITAVRVAAGLVGLGFFLAAAPWTREKRESEGMGCALVLGLFAATGWLGFFPTYLEEHLWPGTPAGQTIRGVAGYLLVWLGGLALVWAGCVGSDRLVGQGTWRPRWAAVVAALGFGVWLGGALYWCGAWSVGKPA